ncbi:hypothetical protein [Planotetraspora sp. GP83]|uniref:hypothetical protein n=1 Tax=Planotetraspora sp. GP83 TaxID=3156264 RepID=UPI0035137DF0
MSFETSSWAVGRFGDRADFVRQQLVTSLLEAMGNAQDAQRWSRSDKRFPYGQTMMTRRYEALVEGFRNEPGFQMVKPYGSPHHLVVLDGNLLLPFRYAEDDTTPITEARITDGRISALARELFTRYGPAASYRQLTLEDEAELAEVRPTLAGLPDDTRLIPVAYAGNAQAGLLRLYWGEAELIDEFGRLRWHHYEPIPLLAAHTATLLPAQPGTATRFDHGAVPDLGLSPRESQRTAVAGGDERP